MLSLCNFAFGRHPFATIAIFTLLGCAMERLP